MNIDNGYLFVALLVAIVNFVTFYIIIENATHSKTINKNIETQTKLLMKIAEKNGVTTEEIDNCLK